MRGKEIQWMTRMGMVLTWKTPTSSLSLVVFEIMCVIQGFICKLQINRDLTMKPSSGGWAGSNKVLKMTDINAVFS